MSSLDSALGSLGKAEEAGAATNAKLEAQNDRLKNLHGEVGSLNGNLDDADASLHRMEMGYFGNKLAGWASALGLGQYVGAQHKEGAPWEHEAFLTEGWLEKRDDSIGSKSWEPRFCKLHEDMLEWYSGEDCKVRKGSVKLGGATRVYAFTDRSAPADAQKLKSESPYGYVVDPDPSLGSRRTSKRRPVYLKAKSDSELQSWIASIRRAARVLQRQKEASSMGEGEPKVQPPDSKLGDINSKLDSLMGQATAMNEKMQQQGAIINHVTKETEQTTDRIDDLRSKTRKV